MSLSVDQALVQSFIDGAFGLPIAHENDSYTPTAGTPFAELRVLKNPTRLMTLADSDKTTGFLQIALNYPAGDGAIAAKTKEQEISAAYPIGRAVTYAGQDVLIVGRQRANAAPQNGWYRLVIRLEFVAITPR